MQGLLLSDLLVVSVYAVATAQTSKSVGGGVSTLTVSKPNVRTVACRPVQPSNFPEMTQLVIVSSTAQSLSHFPCRPLRSLAACPSSGTKPTD